LSIADIGWRVYPAGAKPNPLYGRSSNQELINLSQSTEIAVDDFVFLRPNQSEAVISQFEQVWLYHDGLENGSFTPWPTFRA
jgi:D-serine deaminase-like pyridoxal phosphate-dependent protein